jgi:hypothetical protein
MQEIRNCKFCNNEFIDIRSKTKIFCCKNCGIKYRWRLKHPPITEYQKCLNCENKFIPRYGGIPQKYCSHKCCKNYWRKSVGKDKNRLIQKRQEEKRKLRPDKRFYDIKYQAGIRKHPFHLSYEQFLTFWNGKCHYCGEQIIGIGIDRIDSSKGYEMSNCLPCCSICNKMKNTQSQRDFINRCKIIVNQFTKGTD